MNYTPVRDNLLVELHDEEQVTESGIYMPTNQRGSLSVGKILSMGSGYLNQHGVATRPGRNFSGQAVFSEGDLVAFKLHEMLPRVVHSGKVVYLVPAAEVLAVVTQ